jgi:hypothetical protein
VFENQVVPIRYPLEDVNASIKNKHWKRYENTCMVRKEYVV